MRRRRHLAKEVVACDSVMVEDAEHEIERRAVERVHNPIRLPAEDHLCVPLQATERRRERMKQRNKEKEGKREE